MLRISVNRQQLYHLIHKLTKLKVDELEILHAMAQFCDSLPLLIEEKITLLVGSEKEHKIVGVTFDGRQEIVKLLKVGEVLSLEPDPENKYDKDAVMIKRENGSQVGFLAKELAEAISDIVKFLSVQVTAILGEDAAQETMENTKFVGVRFKFIRKANARDFVAVNLDAIEVIADQFRGTSKEIEAEEEIEKTAKEQITKQRKPKNADKESKEPVPEDAEKLPEDELIF